ncbi:MAG: hypothetical protein AVDCRST_MAG49-3394, partial [uncultured Thermomicrobiales bacterium]
GRQRGRPQRGRRRRVARPLDRGGRRGPAAARGVGLGGERLPRVHPRRGDRRRDQLPQRQRSPLPRRRRRGRGAGLLLRRRARLGRGGGRRGRAPRRRGPRAAEFRGRGHQPDPLRPQRAVPVPHRQLVARRRPDRRRRRPRPVDPPQL